MTDNSKVDELDNFDIKVFETVFEKYKKPLVYFAKSILLNHKEVSEEIVLDVFFKLWERREGFHATSKIKAFLYISVKNSCLTYLNSAYVSRNVLVDNFDERSLISEPEIYSKLISAEAISLIVEELTEISLLQNKVITMSYLDNLENAEIADELNITQNAVYVNKFRGLKELKKRLMIKKKWFYFLFL